MIVAFIFMGNSSSTIFVAARSGAFLCLIPFHVVLLCLVGSVWFCAHLFGEERADTLHFLVLFRIYHKY